MIITYLTIEMLSNDANIYIYIWKTFLLAKKTHSKWAIVWDDIYLGKLKNKELPKITKALGGKFIHLYEMRKNRYYLKRLALLKVVRGRLTQKRKLKLYEISKKCNLLGYIDIEKIGSSNTAMAGNVVFVGKAFYCDETFYKDYKESIEPIDLLVIRGDDTSAGMYGIMAHYITGFGLAYRNNIPVYVDLQHNVNPYIDDGGPLATQNGWDFYFKQPCGLTFRDIEDRKYVEWGLVPVSTEVFNSTYVLKLDNDYIERMHTYVQENVKYNISLQTRIDDEWGKIQSIAQGHKILGVKFRSTDYLSQYGWGEFPFQATPELMVIATKKYLKQWNCDYIYLAVEAEESLNCFINAFGNKVLHYECLLISNYDGKLSAAEEQARITGKVKSGEDYLITEALLAKCDCLLATNNSGAVFAPLLKEGKYDGIHYIQKKDFEN